MCKERSERPDPPHECELKSAAVIPQEMLNADGRMRDVLSVCEFPLHRPVLDLPPGGRVPRD